MTLKEILKALINSEYSWSVAEQFENTFDDSESFEDQNDNALQYINSMLKDILDAYDSPFSNSAKQEIFIYQRKLEDYLKDVEMAEGGMMADGGRIKVGTFDEAQLRKGEDKKAIEKAQKETGLKYIDSKVIKKGGKMFMEVYLTSKYAEGGMMASGGLFDSPQKRSANRGLSWTLDHKRHNKGESYEIPLNKRKRKY
jgi:hypothetical protein